MTRPLYQIALEIDAHWPTPSPHAKAYLKAMRYLIGIEDAFSAGHARRIVRCFLLYSKEWQGEEAERIKAELRDLGKLERDDVTPLPASQGPPAGVEPAACELCTGPIRGKYVHGTSVFGVVARMCPACHYYIGRDFDQADGALYQLQADGRWQLLHGTGPAGSAAAPTGLPFSGKLPLAARARRSVLWRLLKGAWRSAARLTGRRAA